MKKQDWKAFCDCMNAVSSITATQPRGIPALTLAFETLSLYTIEQVKDAVYSHLRSDDGKFFPTPAHIIRQIEGSEQERAHMAWRVFLRALEKYGYYDSVRFPEPAYHYAIELLGGWLNIAEEYRDLTSKELEFRRGAFSTLYMRGERESSWEHIPGKVQVAPYLAGSYERDNLSGGYTDFLPDIIDVETGKVISRADIQALKAQNDDVVLDIPTPNLRLVG